MFQKKQRIGSLYIEAAIILHVACLLDATSSMGIELCLSLSLALAHTHTKAHKSYVALENGIVYRVLYLPWQSYN
jgi:hypothetical protein